MAAELRLVKSMLQQRVGGKAVAQGMGRYQFGQVGGGTRLVADAPDRCLCDGALGIASWAEPGPRSVAFPVGPQRLHALAEELHAYIAAAGIGEERKGWLFRTAKGWKATVLSDEPMAQADAWHMIRRRAKAAGIQAPIGCHTFRATGITAYLENGGTLEHAQAMAAHESPRTTKLYDRTKERLTLDEIERIRL